MISLSNRLSEAVSNLVTFERNGVAMEPLTALEKKSKQKWRSFEIGVESARRRGKCYYPPDIAAGCSPENVGIREAFGYCRR